MTASSQQSKIIPVNILLVGAKNEHKKDVVIYLLIEGEDRWISCLIEITEFLDFYPTSNDIENIAYRKFNQFTALRERVWDTCSVRSDRKS